MDRFKKLFAKLTSPFSTGIRRGSSFIFRLSAALIVVNLLIYGIFGFWLYKDYQYYHSVAENRTQNMAQIIATNISGIFDRIDTGLFALIQATEKQLAQKSVNKAELETYIRRLLKKLPELFDLSVADAAGNIVYGTDIVAGKAISIQDRPYFKYLSENADDELILSKLVHGRVSGKWLFVLAKRINHPDGSFAGTAIGMFDISSFSRLFSQLKNEQQGTIELRDKACNLIAFWPESVEAGCQPGSQIIARKTCDLISATTETATYKTALPCNHSGQMVSLCKTPPYPVYVIAANATDDYLRSWKMEVAAAAIIAVIFTLLSILSAKNLLKSRETELLQMESTRLSEEKARLERVIEGTRAGTWEWNVQTGETIFNERWAEIIGYTLKEIEPVSLDRWISNTHPDDLKASDKMLQKHFNNEIAYYDYECRMKHKDGHWVWILDRGKIISRTHDGKPEWMFGTRIDITPRKMAEEAKERLQTQLNQVQKMESIGNLAGGIAHDFNNILFPIILMSEMLLEDFPEKSPERENIQEIFKAGIRGRDLVKQILAFSRQAEHKMIPARIQNVIKEVLKLSRAALPADIQLHQDIDKNCGMVMADLSQIHQIGMNIMTNAAHSIGNTGGKINVSLKQTRVEVPEALDIGLDPGVYVLISISDTGHGMSQDIMDKIFDPYFTTKAKGKGTGLGLAVVYGIVKKHKGKIKVTSEPGNGSTFDIYLPLLEKTDSIDPPVDIDDCGGGSERILLVDDEKTVARMGEQVLTRLGYKVSVHISSLKAWNYFKEDPDAFDLVITDMTMPEMTGDQLAVKILSLRPDMPIIICTGFSERINQEQAQKLGVKGFLMKPVMKSGIDKMIRRVLGEAKNT